MPTNRKIIGIDKYLDVYYPDQGGSRKFRELLELGVPLTRIAAHFGVSRVTVNNWREAMEVQK